MKAPEVIIKRDTTENWSKAVNYKPTFGTIVIYDNPDGSIQLKIGDGNTLVNDLPDILKNNNNNKPMSNAKVEEGVLQF